MWDLQVADGSRFRSKLLGRVGAPRIYSCAYACRSSETTQIFGEYILTYKGNIPNFIVICTGIQIIGFIILGEYSSVFGI